jgi:hypothetical protein
MPVESVSNMINTMCWGLVKSGAVENVSERKVSEIKLEIRKSTRKPVRTAVQRTFINNSPRGEGIL